MKLSGWGRYPRIQVSGSSFETLTQLSDNIKKIGDCIAYGMGSSYADSALNERVVFSRRFDKILDFNQQDGIVTCESGVALSELVDVLLPRGWFLSITPGTKFT